MMDRRLFLVGTLALCAAAFSPAHGQGPQSGFPFTLPHGYVDRGGELHRTGSMRLATAEDESLALADPRARADPTYFGAYVLARVVTRLGTLETIDVDVMEGLFAVDFDYLWSFFNEINLQHAVETSTPAAAVAASPAGGQAAQDGFSFVLPNGYVDPVSGDLHREGVMRPATAEDKSPNDPPAQDGKASAVLLARVLTQLGSLETIDADVIGQLSAEDLSYLQALYFEISGDARE